MTRGFDCDSVVIKWTGNESIVPCGGNKAGRQAASSGGRSRWCFGVHLQDAETKQRPLQAGELDGQYICKSTASSFRVDIDKTAIPIVLFTCEGHLRIHGGCCFSPHCFALVESAVLESVLRSLARCLPASPSTSCHWPSPQSTPPPRCSAGDGPPPASSCSGCCTPLRYTLAPTPHQRLLTLQLSRTSFSFVIHSLVSDQKSRNSLPCGKKKKIKSSVARRW